MKSRNDAKVARRGAALAGVLLVMATWTASAAVLYTETWDSADDGWTGSTGDATVQHDASGNPGGSMVMSFADSLFPLTDGFFANSGASSGNFGGSYLGITDFAGWKFDLNPFDILPSSIYLRLNGGGNTYIYNVASQLTGTSAWNPVTVSASSGWLGFGGMGGFNAALANVSWIELTITTSGSGAQNYYVDNFRTFDSPSGGGGGSSAVPEPNVMLAYLMGAGILIVARRRFVRPTQMHAHVRYS